MKAVLRANGYVARVALSSLLRGVVKRSAS